MHGAATFSFFRKDGFLDIGSEGLLGFLLLGEVKFEEFGFASGFVLNVAIFMLQKGARLIYSMFADAVDVGKVVNLFDYFGKC
jgi:hypothetical protein